jgi:triacylglycerol lipase
MPLVKKEPIPITRDNLVPPYHDYVYFDDAAGNPFLPAATRFELVNAWWLSEAATLAYHVPERVGAEFAKAGLRLLDPIEDRGTDTDCFVAAGDEFVVVAFRGTETGLRRNDPDFRHIFLDLWTDAQARLVSFGAGAGKVHGGFLAGYNAVEARLRGALAGLDPRLPVWFTGHSLGAALATVAAARAERLQGLYTYGSPRVGDVAFAQSFSRKFADMGGDRHFRFVHDNDVVTVVPPNGLYRHVGSLKHIDSRGRVGDDPTALALLSDTFRDLAAKAVALLHVPFGDRKKREAKLLDLFIEGIIDHVPTLYARDIWNAYVDERGGGV